MLLLHAAPTDPLSHFDPKLNPYTALNFDPRDDMIAS